MDEQGDEMLHGFIHHTLFPHLREKAQSGKSEQILTNYGHEGEDHGTPDSTKIHCKWDALYATSKSQMHRSKEDSKICVSKGLDWGRTLHNPSS